MASVDFKKCKTASDVAAYLRHNDAIERTKHRHANKDIDTTRSHLNSQWINLNYEQTLNRYRARIDYLDSTTNTNKRKDRVTCFNLCIPIPAAFKDTDMFSQSIRQLIESEYGVDNIVNGYLHRDEVHDYIDHGILKTSLEHLHILVVPEIDGRLCGKKFSGKSAMIAINDKINDLCLREQGCSFLTCTPPQKKTVEQLKAEGAEELRQLRESLNKTSGRIVAENENTVTVTRDTYNGLSAKAALYDCNSGKILAETRAIQRAANAVEERYNKAVTLEYNAFEREIRDKVLTAENERLKSENTYLSLAIEVIKRKLRIVEKALSKLPQIDPVIVARKKLQTIICSSHESIIEHGI